MNRRLLAVVPVGIAVLLVAALARPNIAAPVNRGVVAAPGSNDRAETSGPIQDSKDSATGSHAKADVVRGRFGTTDTTAYQGARLATLAATPPVTGTFAAKFHTESTYLGMRSPADLASVSRLVVRGQVVGFSAPYWNSDEGAFWAPRYLPDLEEAVPNALYRDVTFNVVEVLADETGQGFKPGLITFTVEGGQAVVTIPEDVASIDPSFLPSGRYLWRFDPHVDLSLAEDAVLFLDYRELPGLYGGAYGYVIKLMPASERYFKFSVGPKENARNGALSPAADRGPFITTISDLRKLVASKTLGSSVRRALSPDGLVHPMPSGHTEEPVYMPPDEQDGGPTPGPGEGSYEPNEP